MPRRTTDIVPFWLLFMFLSACGGTAPKKATSETAASESEAQSTASEQPAIVKELEKICTEVPCRPETEVKMMVDNDRFFQTTVFGSPYVYDNIVDILAGEKFYFEAEQQPDGALINLKYVAQATNPEKTFEVSFSQNTEGRMHRGMMLKITSPFDGIVRYRADIGLAGRDGVSKTSTCPLHKGVPAMEMWQDLILHVVLTEFRLVDPDSSEAGVCD